MSIKYQRPTDGYSGSAGLANTTKYQDDAAAVPKVAISSSKIDGDFNYVMDALNEIDQASGSRNSINERLNTSLNADGTVKASVVATMDDWAPLSGVNLNRTGQYTLTVSGDRTGLLHSGRRVRLSWPGQVYYASIHSSQFDGQDTVLELKNLTSATGQSVVISTTPSSIDYSPLAADAASSVPQDFNTLHLNGSTGTVIFNNTFGLRQQANSLAFVENTGTVNSPAWQVRGQISSDGVDIGSRPTGALISWDENQAQQVVSGGTEGQVPTVQSNNTLAFQDMLPAGIMMPTATPTAPAHWLLCDGAEISRTTYGRLFQAIGTTYGTGDGSTTFNLPDLRGRTIHGLDNMGGSAANRLPGATSVGHNGGQAEITTTTDPHSLTINEIPPHTHTYDGHGGLGGSGSGGNAQLSTVTATTGSTGDGQGHSHGLTLETLSPYIALNWVIKT